MSWLRFNGEKAAQVAGVLLARAGGSMPYLKLIKLLYFIDREAILRWARSVTTDRFAAMPHGPVVSRIYDLICTGPETGLSLGPWHKHISNSGRYDVKLRQATDDSELSMAELRLIDEVYSRHGSKSKWEVRDLSHELPEWRDPAGSSMPIEIEDILRVEGRTEHEIATIADEIRELSLVESLKP